MLRTIREIKPRWIVGENVYGLVNWSGGLVFHEVQLDLENEGYEVQPYLLPAASVNAPHQRYRIFFVAYRKHNGLQHTVYGGEQGEFSQQSERKELDGSTFFPESIKTESIRGASTNTKNSGCGGERTSTNTNGQRIEKCNISKEPTKSVKPNRANNENKYATNTNGSTTKYNSGADNRTSETIRRENEGDVSRELCSNGDVANTNVTGFQGREQQRQGESNERFKRPSNVETSTNTESGGGIEFSIPNWNNFPTTQPTIRIGDDGIPNKLDGITVSKWRNESIKAAGNAVVPQLILQLFKAIQQYENEHNR
jgi:DNA (cytosine-5)-methyltransferase 1